MEQGGQCHLARVARDVGFSFSKTPGDAINVTDAQSAGDVYRFLQTFFTDLFPQFQSNPFYVTGKSLWLLTANFSDKARICRRILW